MIKIGMSWAVPVPAEVEPSAVRLALAANPTPGSVRLSLTMASPEAERLSVYDLQGRRIRELHQGMLPPGARSLRWDGRTGVNEALGGEGQVGIVGGGAGLSAHCGVASPNGEGRGSRRLSGGGRDDQDERHEHGKAAPQHDRTRSDGSH